MPSRREFLAGALAFAAAACTGGGKPKRSIGSSPPIGLHPSIDELVRDLRLARHWSDELLIHSLEGCVQQGFLGRLRSFEWGQAATPPEMAWGAAGLRRVLRGLLWASAHPRPVLSGVAATVWLVSRWRRRA